MSAEKSAGYFSEGSADDLLANNWEEWRRFANQQVLHFSWSLPRLLCLASKYGLSGSGRGVWDQVAMVVRDRATNVIFA